MREIVITYDTKVMEDEVSFIGETCIVFSVLNGIAYNLVNYGQSGVAMHEIEKAIVLLERLKGRTYVRGSIKDIRYKCEGEIIL